MKNILAIETSTNICSVALFLDGSYVESIELDEPRSHASKLPIFIDKLLDLYKYDVSNLDGIAVSSGPGSYTGLRIGMSIAKGLALSSDLPILPINSLQAMGMGIKEKTDYWICIYSHKNMVFAQKFRNQMIRSEPKCVDIKDLSSISIYGINLNKIEQKIIYNHISPSSKKVGEFALINSKELIEKKLELISPLYLAPYTLDNK